MVVLKGFCFAGSCFAFVFLTYVPEIKVSFEILMGEIRLKKQKSRLERNL